MTQARVNKTTSFSRKDEYEVELLEFAVAQSRYFGRYVKRLIADHRARVGRGEGDLLVVSPLERMQTPYDVVQARPVASTAQGGRTVPEAPEPSESSVNTANEERSIEPHTFDLSGDMSNFI